MISSKGEEYYEMFNENKYYESLMERLLQCTEDEFSLSDFYRFYENLNLKDNNCYLQIFVDFIYRCLKSDLIKLDIPDMDFCNENLENHECFINLILSLPIKKETKNFSKIENYIWLIIQVSSTELLDNIAKECDLVAYEDEVDFSTEKGRKFRDKIEKVWADNGLPWDLEHPLFPVPLESVAITGEQREEDRETEVGQ